MKRAEKIKLKKKEAIIKSLNDLKEISPFVSPTNRRVQDLINDNQLDINPFFQRNYVWTEKKASQLIESTILNLPIPEIYSFIDSETNKEMIIDGQQRLTSALNFVKNKYKLTGLTQLSVLNNLNFFELPQEYQLKINRYDFRINKIENVSDRKVVFEIFRRFNSGSVSLNSQEIRNCIYNGKFNDLINEIAQNKPFKTLLSKKNGKSRMEEPEHVLRFFAFEQGLNRYNGKLNSFLDDYMEKETKNLESLDESKLNQEIENLKKLFKKSFDIAHQVFGSNTFKPAKLKEDKKGIKRLSWGKISKAVFDIQMLGFVDYEQREIMEHIDSIREAFINLSLNDTNFLGSFNTSSKKALQNRVARWKAELQQIISVKRDPRTFSLAIKKELYKKNQKTCSRCGQEIESIEDAQIDHHNPYWKGGESIPENARLMHRFCNQSKGGK